ncbi:hypothetical protein [Algoriphagus marinus]|uniref:hypothetical protein n=1 Tax=Algoriphagus marinus TaxID=1925762 RepID=UPI0011153CFE|nr:hypothetical protein [Algoriphagus marinus]
MKRLLLLFFFLAQVFGVVYTKFSSVNYFGWVPFDQISFYEITVSIDSVKLSSLQVSNRYNLPNPGRENRSISHVFSQISQFERSYGKSDSAQVRVIYRVNGKEEEVWDF